MNFLMLVLILGIVNAKLQNWTGDLKQFGNWNKNIKYGGESIEFVSDPKDNSKTVLKIKYAKSTYSNGFQQRGTAVYVYPFGRQTKLTEATFEYDVLFASNFEWVRGGKLPGMFGGQESCTGHKPAHNCYSARLMWRANGEGHPYLYISNKAPHLKEFCSYTQYRDCYRKAGFNFNRTHYFTKNEWVQVKEYIKLNSKPSKADGVLKLWINGEEKVNYNKIIWRQSTDIFTLGFQIETFFGGNDPSWETPVDTYTLYKGFKFYNY